jgi:hypothetical protein
MIIAPIFTDRVFELLNAVVLISFTSFVVIS